MRSLRLSIVIATMASFSTVLLGMGQGSVWLPILTILAAVGSVVLTDALRWFHLHRIIANVAMVAAAIFSLSGFFGSSSLEQLQAIAKLLTYVQLVLLFQEKSVRIYGQLAMFSLLQVVVAALLNDSLEFGVLLIVYMVIAVCGIALFFVYREVERAGNIQPRRRWFFRRAVEGGSGGAQLAAGRTAGDRGGGFPGHVARRGSRPEGAASAARTAGRHAGVHRGVLLRHAADRRRQLGERYGCAEPGGVLAGSVLRRAWASCC